MSTEPLPTDINGAPRDGKGRFGPGNKAGRGNPLNRKAQRIRNAILKAATPEDVADIARKLIDGARAGDLAYIREFLDRTIGKPVQSDVLERLEALEAAIAKAGEIK